MWLSLILFFYLVVTIRVVIHMVSLYMRLKNSEFKEIASIFMRKNGLFMIFWPLDFMAIPGVFIKAYLFFDANSMGLLGLYYSRKPEHIRYVKTNKSKTAFYDFFKNQKS